MKGWKILNTSSLMVFHTVQWLKKCMISSKGMASKLGVKQMGKFLQGDEVIPWEGILSTEIPFLFCIYSLYIYQTRCCGGCSTNTFVINWLSQSSFSSRSLKHHNSQTIRARELKLWENVHPVSRVRCLLSYVTCHLSPIMCHMSLFLVVVAELVCGRSVINGAYPV